MKVSATRMQLLRLKRRLVLARRGHKLLKDKQDELVRQFLLFIREAGRIRETAERELAVAYAAARIARIDMSGPVHETAVAAPRAHLRVTVKHRQIMNLKVPELSAIFRGDLHPYGFAETSAALDRVVETMAGVAETLVKLAEVERGVMLLSVEIESVRRRVNALEYVLIPELAAGVREITMKLSEMERSALTRLMRVKDIIEAKAAR
ncbi:MAG: V-type ATP synthase subunit D [Planctomycetota bacterium]